MTGAGAGDRRSRPELDPWFTPAASLRPPEDGAPGEPDERRAPVVGSDPDDGSADYVVIVLDGGYGIGDVHGPYSGFGATVVADALQRRLAARGYDDLEVRVARLHR